MTAETPIVELREVRKQLESGLLLRIRRFQLDARDKIALFGFDRIGAESFVHLLTGAMLPDSGDILIAGRNTRAIATDADWLHSLDRFGLVTERAVLLDGMPLIANLALPLTVAVDPPSAETRAQVTALAREVGLPEDTLSGPAGQLNALDRLRAHLARALATGPSALLLEHPTQALEPPASAAFGELLARVSAARGLAWIALTADATFATAAGARRFTLDASSGVLDVAGGGFWSKLFHR